MEGKKQKQKQNHRLGVRFITQEDLSSCYTARFGSKVKVMTLYVSQRFTV